MKHTKENCNHCGVDLVLNSNYEQHRLNRKDYVCKECYNHYIKKSNSKAMYVNGKYVSRKHPLHKAGRFKTFEGAAFASLEGYANTTEGYVYIINNPCWDGWVKVGMAIDAEDRCKQYQTSSPYRDYKLCYLKHFEDRKIAEQSAHKELKKITDTYNGEWFQTSVKEAKKTIEAL